MQLMNAVVCAVLVATAFAHSGHNDQAGQMPLDYVKYPYQAVYPGDNEGMLRPVTSRSRQAFTICIICTVTADSIFSGITTFAKLPWHQCLTKDKDDLFDIAFLGAPFVS
jgi:agmatinase